MDQKIERAVELTLEEELIRNARVVEHPTFGQVKIQRPTPRMERMIADERRKQYHKDLKDKTILSRAEIEREAIERGMWSPTDAEKVAELVRKVGGLMGVLEALEYKSLDEVIDAYYRLQRDLIGQFEQSEVHEAIERYFDLEQQPMQADRSLIWNEAPNTTVDELLDTGDHLRTQIDLLQEMLNVRKELNALQKRQVEIFLDSIESRAERAEELARIYFCCSKAESGLPLWPTFDDAWDADPSDIEVLISEVYYFMHGITEEFKVLLGKHGFIQRVADIEDSSESSQGHPELSLDGELQESELQTSSGLDTSTS